MSRAFPSVANTSILNQTWQNLTPGCVQHCLSIPWAFPLAPPPHWCQWCGPCRVFPCHESARQSHALSASQRCWPLTHSRTQWSVWQRPGGRKTVHFSIWVFLVWDLTSPRSRMKQSPLLKLLQVNATSLARMLRLPLIWYNLCTVPVVWDLLNADSTPPSCETIRNCIKKNLPGFKKM